MSKIPDFSKPPMRVRITDRQAEKRVTIGPSQDGPWVLAREALEREDLLLDLLEHQSCCEMGRGACYTCDYVIRVVLIQQLRKRDLRAL